MARSRHVVGGAAGRRQREQPQQLNRSSEPQGLVYAARISLDRTQMQTPIDNRKTPRLYSQGRAGANYLLAQGLHP